MLRSVQVNDRRGFRCRLESGFISVSSIIKGGSSVHKQLVCQSHGGIATAYPKEGFLKDQRKMRVGVDIDICIHDGGQVSQSVDLATFFSSTTASVCYIHRVQEWSVVPLATLLTKTDKQKSRCGRVFLRDSQLGSHNLCDVKSITFVHPVFVITRKHRKDFVLDRLKYLHALL